MKGDLRLRQSDDLELVERMKGHREMTLHNLIFAHLLYDLILSVTVFVIAATVLLVYILLGKFR